VFVLALGQSSIATQPTTNTCAAQVIFQTGAAIDFCDITNAELNAKGIAIHAEPRC
jgi:hypothetical protein